MAQNDAPAFLNPFAQAVLVEQAAIEAALIDILDLPRTDPRVLAYAERLHAHARRCIDFAQRISRALNAHSN